MISPSSFLNFQVTSEGSEGVGLVLAMFLFVQGGIQRCCHQCSPWLHTRVQAPIPGTHLPPSCLLKTNWEAGSPLTSPLWSWGSPHSSSPQCHCCLQWHWAPVLTLCWPQVLLVPCSSSGRHSQCPVLGLIPARQSWCQLPICAEGVRSREAQRCPSELAQCWEVTQHQWL